MSRTERREDREIDVALCVAAADGNAHRVLRLIEGGADVNYSSAIYGTPLHRAVEWGREGCVRLLLDVGAKANARYK